MKNFKIFKPILCSLLIFSLLLSLFACTKSDSEDITEGSGTTKFPMDSTYYDNLKDYKIIAVDDGYRIVLMNHPYIQIILVLLVLTYPLGKIFVIDC